MTLILELPNELQSELAAEAARLGMSIDQYVVRLLSAGRTGEGLPRTGEQLVAFWKREGLVGTRPDITDSQAHAGALREQTEKRMRS